MNDIQYYDVVTAHYESVWQNKFHAYLWDKGPIEQLHANFKVLEFPPTQKRKMWTYATVGMSTFSDIHPIELHIFSSKKDDSLVELLQMTAYYHKNNAKLNLHHTINFGRSWQGSSLCKHGYISLPYLDGPAIEDLPIEGKILKFYWLIPITEKEVEYKKNKGIDELENLFDVGLDYINSNRSSLV